MIYMGSKRRLAKKYAPILNEAAKGRPAYVEPFMGGLNMMEHIEHPRRIGADLNEYVVEMFRHAIAGGSFPSSVTAEDWGTYKANPDICKATTGFVGVACSFGARWFSNYARRKAGLEEPEVYPGRAIRALEKQVPRIADVELVHSCYTELEIPEGSVVYCDPPYKGVKGYMTDIDHAEFWRWCMDLASRKYCSVFVSEYEAPEWVKAAIVHEEHVECTIRNHSERITTNTEKLFLILP